MLKIDKKDLKILEILEKNSRQPISRIAKNLKLSPQTTFYRINRLVSENVILAFPTIVDHAYTHLIEIAVYYKISYISENKLKEIISYFLKHKYVTSIQECGGNWDLAVTYLVDNLSRFNKILHKDIQEFPKQFSSYDIFFTVVTHFFHINKKSNIIIGGDRPQIKLTKSNLLLLYHLSSDSRISILDLSKKLKKDPKTVIKKINNLKKLGLIKGFTIEKNESILNYSTHKFFISYTHPTLEEEENDFLKYAKKQEEVISLTKLMGKYNLALTVKTKSELELRRLLFRLREKYSNIVHEILDIPIYMVHKRIYLPESVIRPKLT